MVSIFTFSVFIAMAYGARTILGTYGVVFTNLQFGLLFVAVVLGGLYRRRVLD